MQNKIILWVIIIFFIFSGCKSKESNPIRFLSEAIKMTVDSGRVSVSGTYYFKNLTDQPKTARIFYPFPIDEFHYYPDLILVSGLDYRKSDSGISFIMKFKPLAIESLAILYEQKLKDSQTRYILTTTKNWKHPIQEARFIVTLPENNNINQLSYPPDSSHKKEHRIYYYITKKNFMPENDLIVSWQ